MLAIVFFHQSSHNPERTKRAQVPETVVDGSDGATVLGMADLSEQQRRAHLRERVAETEQETTTHVH